MRPFLVEEIGKTHRPANVPFPGNASFASAPGSGSAHASGGQEAIIKQNAHNGKEGTTTELQAFKDKGCGHCLSGNNSESSAEWRQQHVR